MIGLARVAVDLRIELVRYGADNGRARQFSCSLAFRVSSRSAPLGQTRPGELRRRPRQAAGV